MVHAVERISFEPTTSENVTSTVSRTLPDASACDVALTVFVPVSGGGLASGVAAAVKGMRDEVRVIGVEPELAADARDSLREDRIVRWPAEETGRTMADGLRVTALGRITFAHLRVIPALPRHHRDPFDRMMIAQALAEGIPIATSDRA